MAIHLNIIKKPGWQNVITPENSELKYLSFSIYHSNGQEKITNKTAEFETALVIIQGNINIYIENKLSGCMKRRNVFEDLPSSVYIPPFTEYSLEFTGPSELCAISTPAKKKIDPALIASCQLKTELRGESNSQRKVTDIINQNFPAERLIIGETINEPGHWSSYPPHKHDRDLPSEEVKLEEIYYFKIIPSTGFGMIRIFDDLDDELFLLKNNDLVTIPKGYHPVAVAPGHQIYYLWALAGEQRLLKAYTHPDYRF